MNITPLKFYERDVVATEIEKTLQKEIKTLNGKPLHVDDLITLDGMSSTVLQFTRSGAIRKIADHFYYVRDPRRLGVQPITIHPNPQVGL